MKKISIAILVLFIIGCTNNQQETNNEGIEESAEQKSTGEDEWTSLFNGEDLSGWEVLGGDANFQVEDGMIVGITEEDLPNCFLATKKQYDDFILEADFKIDPNINSGIQIRSAVYEKDTTTAYLNGRLEEGTRDWEAGRVHGYQIEIDPSDRAWTGGFYEEGGRGWLQPLNENEEAQEAYKPEEWNHLKIRADGNTFTTWLNGVPAANTTDNQMDSGFIALQLHGAWKEEQVGQKVYFKNIRIKEL